MAPIENVIIPREKNDDLKGSQNDEFVMDNS